MSFNNCAICISPPMYPTTAECGHIYCKSCILKWVSRKDICPLCNKTDIEKTLTPSFRRELAKVSAEKTSDVVVTIISKLQNPRMLSDDEVLRLLDSLSAEKRGFPLVVLATAYDWSNGVIRSVRLAQTSEVDKEFYNSVAFGTVPESQKKGYDAPCKVGMLRFIPPILTSEAFARFDLKCGQFPKLTFKKINGLVFHKGCVSISSDVSEFHYPTDAHLFRDYQAAKDQTSMDACIQKAMRYIFSQKHIQQIHVIVTKEVSALTVRQGLHALHKEHIGAPAFVHIFEFDHAQHPALRCHVGITASFAKERPGIPIRKAASLDRIEEIEKAMGKLGV